MAQVTNFPVLTVNGGVFATAILAGGTVSTPLSVAGASIVAIIANSNVLATNLTFNLSIDGVNYFPAYYPSPASTLITLPIAPTQWITGLGNTFLGALFIQIVSSTTQTAGCTFNVVMRLI